MKGLGIPAKPASPRCAECRRAFPVPEWRCAECGALLHQACLASHDEVCQDVCQLEHNEQDVGLLRYKEDSRGKRDLVIQDGVDQLLTSNLKENDFVDGPDIVIFCGRHMSFNSGTPNGYHNMFVADGGLDHNDLCVLEPGSLCCLFQVGIETDQLHASQLVPFELICRGIHRMESRFKDCFLGKLEIHSGGGKKGGGRARANPERDLHLFLGSSSIRGRLCICPQLFEWLAERKHREYSMLKDDRTLVEERRALQSGNAPPGKI